MAKNISISDIINLSVSERIQFVEDVWDSIANIPEELNITKEQKKELDQRLEAYHVNPELGTPWEKIRKKFL